MILTHFIETFSSYMHSLGLNSTRAYLIVTTIYTFFTALIVYYSYAERKRNRRVSQMELYFRVNDNLSKKPLQEAYQLISSQAISFTSFEQNAAFVKNIGGEVFSIYIVRELLNAFEDLALLKEQKLIDFNTINSGYGTMILTIGKNNEIKKYINFMRTNGDKTYFEGLEALYKSSRCKLEKQVRIKYPEKF